MDTKESTVLAAYEKNAESLIDMVAEAFLKEGLKLEKTWEPRYLERRDPVLSLKAPSIRIKADQVSEGYSRFSRTLTEEAVLYVQIGGTKARYPKRKDGTYNIDGIVKNVLEAVKYHNEREGAMAAYRKREEENREIQAKETEGIVVPPGASGAARDPVTGTYGFVFRGQFENLSLEDLGPLYEAIAALTKKYKFHSQV